MKVLLFLLMISTNAIAENWVYIGGWSKHINGDPRLNENHKGLGFELEINGSQYFLFKFENSLFQTSYYGGKIVRDGLCYDNLCLGYSLGFLKGYSFKDPAFIGFGVVSYEYQGVGIDISCLPTSVCEGHLRISDKAFDWAGINAPWDTKGYIKVSLDHYDPDNSGKWGFYRNNGVSYDIKLYLTNDVYFKGNYTTTVFNFAPEQGNSKFQATWAGHPPSRANSQGYIAIGKDYEKYSLAFSYNQFSVQQNYINIETRQFTAVPETHYKGFGVHLSRTYPWSKDFDFYLEAAIIDSLVTDLKITAEIQYKFSDKIDFTLGVIDWERRNYSQFQFGIRYNF